MNIIELCDKENITLIGIKFPLADEYSRLIGGRSYGADSILRANGITIYDFRDIFRNTDYYFDDPDHISERGGEKLIGLMDNLKSEFKGIKY